MYLLALVAMLHLTEAKPLVGSWFDDRDECLQAARRGNNLPDVISAEGKSLGLQFVCFKLIEPGAV